MFFRCSSLKELNLSNFITNNATNICCMFSGCTPNIILICKNNLIKREYKKLNI